MKFKIRKIFVITSIIFINLMVLFYGSRFVYFYIKENKKTVNETYTLVDTITSSENLLNNNDSMSKDNDKYYFYGKKPKNYIYYSGLMYRILYIENNTIYAITDEVVTNLKFGESSSFKNSNINEWLNNKGKSTGIFVNNLSNTKLNLVSDEIKLLDKNVFAKIGANKSFVVGEDFWVLDNDNALVVSENGELTKTSNYADFLGVKPVIEIKGSNNYIAGDGTKNNPYIIERRQPSVLSDVYVGEYLKYNNNNYRIIEKGEKGIKVLSVSKLEKNHIFSYNNNLYNTNNYYDLGYYLNNVYINSLNSKDLVKTEWYTGEYILDYKQTYNTKVKAKIGLLKIGDYFIKSVKNSYLLTPSNDYIYTIDQNSNLYADAITTKLDIYPVFKLNKNLKISSGNGYQKDPYVVGD